MKVGVKYIYVGGSYLQQTQLKYQSHELPRIKISVAIRSFMPHTQTRRQTKAETPQILKVCSPFYDQNSANTQAKQRRYKADFIQP